MTDSCDAFARRAHDFMEKRKQEAWESGIQLLPNEVLARIFYFTDDPICLSHVCQRFRRVALENSFLWSQPPIRPRSLTSLFLDRSNNSLLNMQLQGLEISPEKLNDCVTYDITLIKHASRFGQLEISHFDRVALDGLLRHSADADYPRPFSALLHMDLLRSSSSILDLVNTNLLTLRVQVDFRSIL